MIVLYPETDGQQTLDGKPTREPNLDPEIVQDIADGLGLKFVRESNGGGHLKGGLHLSESEKVQKDGAHLRDGPHRDTFALYWFEFVTRTKQAGECFQP